MIPTRLQSFQLLWAHNVPENIIRHSIVVSRVAAEVAKNLKGEKINLVLLDRACILHDIGKLNPKGIPHELEGYEILKKHGFDEVADVVRTHTLHYILGKDKPRSLEQKIVFYADKRVMHHKVVSVDVRISDLAKRYPNFKDSIEKSRPFVHKLEKELTGKNVNHKAKKH